MGKIKHVPKQGMLARVGRRVASAALKLGYDSFNPTSGRVDSSPRGWYPDDVLNYTQAPIATRKSWELYEARNVSRNLYLKSSIFSSFVHWCAVNVVGTNESRLEFKGCDIESRKRLEDAFSYIRNRWNEYQAGEISVCGSNLKDFTKKLLRDALIDGDVFVRPYKEDGVIKYQGFPGDSLVENMTGPIEGGNQRQLGVEINRVGKVVAYWFGWGGNFRPVNYGVTTSSQNAIRVPAEEVWHLRPRTDGVQDLRSFPWAVSVIDEISRLEQFDESFIRAAIRRSSVGIALQQDLESTFADDFGTGNVKTLGDVSPEQGIESDGKSDVRALQPFQEARANAGNIMTLSPGYKATTIGTGSPTAQEADIVKMMQQKICSGLGVTKMTLLGDYSAVSFSAGQMGMSGERSAIDLLQDFLTEQLYKKIYKKWLEQEYRDLILKFNIREEDRKVLFNPTIILKPYPILEINRIAPGLIPLFNMGIITLAELRNKLGFSTSDLDSVIEQSVNDRKRLGVYGMGMTSTDDSFAEEPDLDVPENLKGKNK